MSYDVKMEFTGTGNQWSDIIEERESPKEKLPVSSSSSSGGKSGVVAPNGTHKRVEQQNKAEKEFKEGDYVLEGTLNMREAKPSIKSKRNVTLEGFGKTVSGLYYVQKVTNTFKSNGYTQTLTVKSNGMGGNSNKDTEVTNKPQPKPTEKPRPKEITPAPRPTEPSVIDGNKKKEISTTHISSSGKVHGGGGSGGRKIPQRGGGTR